jgi:DNA invertase Pin-like site-specific DNA recombinase
MPTVVIYDRLSRLFADEAPDHRIAECRRYAAARGWDVVHVATDHNISGATQLEDRPGMREVLAWLPRADYVLAAKVDRYARSVLEFERLLKAAAASRTTIVTADGVVSPESASVMIKMLSIFAEYERDMIKARITASKEHHRQKGNHLGGLPPYGYQVVGAVNAKRWEVDETAAAIIRECASRLVHNGEPIASLARDLNKRGVLPPRDHASARAGRELAGQQWHTTTLRDVLYTHTVRGWLVQATPGTKRSALTNQPVLDADGSPVSAGPAILDAEAHAAVRAALDAKAKGRGTDRSGKAILLHIAFCSECDGPMYRQRREVRGKDYSTYVCRNGIGKLGSHRPNVVTASYVEAMVTEDYLQRFGRHARMRWAEPDGSAVLQLSEVTSSIERLAGNLAQLDPNGHAARVVIGQLTALERRQAELQAEAEHSVGRWVDTGGTIAEEWQKRDDEGRRTLLADLGTRVVIRPATPGAPKRFDQARVSVDFDGPAWLRDRDPECVELAAIADEEAGGQSNGPKRDRLTAD